MTSLGFVDWLICGGYLIVVLLLGLYFSREQHSNEDFFVGGRTMHWLPIGLSLFAGTFSSLSFVGLPADAAYEDYHLLLGILCIPLIVTPIIWFFFLPLFFRHHLTSVYEYIEWRFDRRLRLAASLLFLLYNIGWMGNLLRAVGVIMQAVLELSDSETAWLLVGVGLFATFYTALGGVKAVVWTDALQAVSLGGGMLVVLLLAVDKIEGGWNTIIEVGQAHGKFDMFHTKFDFQHPNVYAALAFGVFVYLASHSVHFTAVQRYVSMPDIKAARKSLLVNGAMVGGVCGLFFVVGTVLFVFHHPPGDVAVSSGLFGEMAAAGTKDQLLPRFVMRELPVTGLMGLLLAGLFAAAMSSIDSGINSMTASIVCDWLPNKEMQINLRLSRILCLVFGVIASALSVVIFYFGGQVFPLIMKIAGLFLGGILGVFVLGMLSRRANAPGATIGLLAGALGGAVAFQIEASSFWFGAFTSVPTFIVGWLASFAFPAPDPTQVERMLVRSWRE
jgi:SSS family transporter